MKPLANHLALGDIEHGCKLLNQCGLCHMPRQNGSKRLGQNVRQIIGCPVGSIKGFNYTSAMRNFAKWCNMELW